MFAGVVPYVYPALTALIAVIGGLIRDNQKTVPQDKIRKLFELAHECALQDATAKGRNTAYTARTDPNMTKHISDFKTNWNVLCSAKLFRAEQLSDMGQVRTILENAVGSIPGLSEPKLYTWARYFGWD